MPLSIYGLTVLFGVLMTVAQVFFRKAVMGARLFELLGPREIFWALAGLLFNPYLILGVLISLAGLALWLMVLSQNVTSILYPIAGGTFYLLMFAVSAYLFQESVSLWNLAGVMVILLGIALITAK